MNGSEGGKRLGGKQLSMLLPDYPRTLHLPHNPNAQRDDLVASEKEAKVIFTSKYTYVEEKVDGANCAIMVRKGHPVIRNRNHVLGKGFTAKTPAKMQFSGIWNWYYENAALFEKVNELAGTEVGVYGEWLVALHGIRYDKLPSVFLPFDLYDVEREYYMDPGESRKILEQAGFNLVPLLWQGPVKSYEQLEAFCQETSPFASERREGVYVKVSDGKKVVERFKMVRTDFIQGCHWSKVRLQKNKVLPKKGRLACGLTENAIKVFKLAKEQQDAQAKVE